MAEEDCYLTHKLLLTETFAAMVKPILTYGKNKNASRSFMTHVCITVAIIVSIHDALVQYNSIVPYNAPAC